MVASPFYRSAYEITKDLFAVGLAEESQMLDAERALLFSESTWVESEQSMTSDLVAVYKAMGRVVGIHPL